MKKNKFALIAASVLVIATSCEKDGETIYSNGMDSAEINSSNTEIVLDKDNLTALALTVSWNENGNITLSNPDVKAPDDAVTNTIQFSGTETFGSVVEEIVDYEVYYRQYTVEQLNSIVSRLGFEGGVRTPLYIRVKSSLGANVEPTYSNVLTVYVTPYTVDMSVALYLDSSQNETGRTLASLASDGIYTGFIGAGSWENWWMRDGNGTIWGNDGVDGVAFMVGNSNTGLEIWNFWYPGIAGCYYTTVDTKSNEWSALLIPALSVSGDISGDMTYDRKANVWSLTFNSASAKTASFSITGVGKLYNMTTDTNDDSAIDTPVGFGGDASQLTFNATAGNILLDIPAGEVTILLDLNDPKSWTVALGEAPEPAAAVAPVLYLSGVYGEWTFDWYVSLYDEDNLKYGAVLPVDSEWGYKIYPEADNWDDFYSMVDGSSAYEGQLEQGGGNNVAAPESGLYLFDISLSEMTYKLTAVTKVSYTGLNDDWSLTEMTATETPGVYTAVVTKYADTPWGVKILLNDSWDLYFGGNGTPGALALNHDGFEGDNELENGTYTLTVDLAKCTYSYSK